MHSYFSFINKYVAKENIKLNEPCLISHTCFPESISYLDSDAFSIKDAIEKFPSGPPFEVILRRFIRNNGDQLQITRLINYVDEKSPFAIIISNRTKFDTPISSLQNRFTIADITYPNCDCDIIFGKSIEPYLVYANSIIEFLSKVINKKGLWISNSEYYN